MIELLSPQVVVVPVVTAEAPEVQVVEPRAPEEPAARAKVELEALPLQAETVDIRTAEVGVQTEALAKVVAEEQARFRVAAEAAEVTTVVVAVEQTPIPAARMRVEAAVDLPGLTPVK